MNSHCIQPSAKCKTYKADSRDSDAERPMHKLVIPQDPQFIPNAYGESKATYF